MNRTAKIVMGIFILTLLIIIIKISYKSFYNEAFTSHECWAQSKKEKIEISGIVTSKFIDSKNHDANAILVNNNNEISEVFFSSVEDSVIWKKIKVNDQLQKSINSLTYYLENNSKKDTVTVKYNCDGKYYK